MFGWEFPPFQAGGLATATHGLVKGLLHCGVDVTLVVPVPLAEPRLPGLRLVSAADTRAALATRGVPSTLLPYVTPEHYAREHGRRAGNPTDVYGSTLFDEVDRYAACAAAIAAEEPHDIIDTHDWLTFEAGVRARAVSGQPLVAHIHATEEDRAGPSPHAEIARREYEGLRAADRVISNSHRLRAQVVRNYFVPADRVDVVHWGIDPEEETGPVTVQPRRSRGGPVVLFIGRITWQKGPLHFLAAARRILDVLPGARFIMAGDGDLLPSAIERSAELGLAARVHFTGGLDSAEVNRAFRMADVCVMPSVSEPFGLVALESLRAGTPCLVPASSGVAEVLRSRLTVHYADPDDIADKVIALFRYPVLHAELQARGSSEVRSAAFGLAEPARRTLESYRRALSARGSFVHA